MKKSNLKLVEKKRGVRQTRPEGFYENIWTSKFVNKLMVSGKKGVVERILQNFFLNFKSNVDSENMKYFLISNLEKLKLPIEIKKRRKSRIFIAVPFPITLRRQYIKALTLIVSMIKYKKYFKKKLKYRVIAAFSELNHTKVKMEDSKIFRQKLKQQEFIQEIKANKRFRWV